MNGASRRSRRLFVGGAALFLAGCSWSSSTTRTPAKPAAPAHTFSVSGSGGALPSARALAEAYAVQHPEVAFRFERGTNSGGAIRGVAEGTLDIAVVNRPLSPEEAAKPLSYTAYAKDAVAFVATPSAPVAGLSRAQIQAIFGGDATSWSQLGGPDEPVIVLDRDEDESMRKLVLLPLLAGRPIGATTTVLTSADEMMSALRDTPGALGYATFGGLKVANVRTDRVIAIDGVVPSSSTVGNGTYPWNLTFGLVVRGDAPPALHAFAAAACGNWGAGVLEKLGYAPV
ncbi:MAG: substrate-binding domain-containing protein [Chloroflexota bacterium]